MRKIILIVVAIAALAGAWYLGKTTGKDCCKETGKAGEDAALADFNDGPQSRIRILNVFAFEDTTLDIVNCTYKYKIGNSPEEDLTIYVEENRRYSAVFQSFRKKGGPLQSQRPNNDGDFEIEDDKMYRCTFIITQIDKAGNRKVILDTKHELPEDQYTGKTLKDAKSNLFYQYIPVRKTDKSEGQEAKRDGDIKPLQNPPINPIGPAPGPG
jgi:hypothetical protein